MAHGTCLSCDKKHIPKQFPQSFTAHRPLHAWMEPLPLLESKELNDRGSMPKKGCGHGFSAKGVSNRSFSRQGAVRTVKRSSLKWKIRCWTVTFSCFLVLLILQMALQNKFHAVNFSISDACKPVVWRWEMMKKRPMQSVSSKGKKVKIPEIASGEHNCRGCPTGNAASQAGQLKTTSELLLCAKWWEYYTCNRACGRRRGTLEVI